MDKESPHSISAPLPEGGDRATSLEIEFQLMNETDLNKANTLCL